MVAGMEAVELVDDDIATAAEWGSDVVRVEARQEARDRDEVEAVRHGILKKAPYSNEQNESRKRGTPYPIRWHP